MFVVLEGGRSFLYQHNIYSERRQPQNVRVRPVAGGCSPISANTVGTNCRVLFDTRILIVTFDLDKESYNNTLILKGFYSIGLRGPHQLLGTTFIIR